MGSDKQELDEVVSALEGRYGWRLKVSGPRAHPKAKLYCPHGQQGGCIIKVYGTAINSARAVWRIANRCEHGGAPGTPRW